MAFSSPFSYRIVVAVLFLNVFFIACKENTILPSSLIPPVDNINTFAKDTFTIITNNVYQDSILTGGKRNSTQVSNSPNLFHALGTITSDPSFGKTNANIHLEVLPPVTNFAFKTNFAGTNRTIDSIVLAIPFKTAYGDTNMVSNIPQNFKVFRSIKSFHRDSAQFEFTKDSFENTLLAQTTLNYSQLKDSHLVNGVKVVPQIRFALSKAFRDSLEAQVDLGANGAAADFSKFLSWWKGFYIQADSLNGNALYYLNTYSARMNIYYRYTNTSGKQDTVVDVFSFDPNNCNRFNNITRNYAGTVAQNFINSTAPLGDSILFLQNEPGMAALISMPYITQFENVVVNKAELFFYSISPYANFSDTIKYGTIPRLQIFQTDTNQVDNVIADYAVFGSNIVDGTYEKVSFGPFMVTRYKFAVTYSIQRIISEKNTNFRFKIMGLNNGFPGAYRVMLGGSSTTMPYVKPQLKIIYTKIIKN